MKYIKCTNYINEVSFVEIDKIVDITRTIDGSIAIATVNADTFYTDVEALKNPIDFEKVSVII